MNMNNCVKVSIPYKTWKYIMDESVTEAAETRRRIDAAVCGEGDDNKSGKAGRPLNADHPFLSDAALKEELDYLFNEYGIGDPKNFEFINNKGKGPKKFHDDQTQMCEETIRLDNEVVIIHNRDDRTQPVRVKNSDS